MVVAIAEAMSNDKNIKQLNSFLRGELSAVQTYDQAIEKLRHDEPEITNELRACRESHRRRVDELTREVRRLGGVPATDAGVWGSFAKAVEGTAKLFGKKAAINALEEGEDHGRNDYQRDLGDLDPPEREFIQQKIMPEQRMTHDSLSRLQHEV
jgi:uncharacterized protein (TIGR02284 family)